MTENKETKQLAPWAYMLPADWGMCRIDSVAELIFSNVDKHTIDEELPVHLCNYVDVYKNTKITGALDFMEASADRREITNFQIQRGDVLVTKDSETPDDIAISALVEEDLPGVVCGYHLSMIRPRVKRVHGPFLAWLHASKQFRAQYEAKAVGVTRFGLSQYAFRSAVTPLPSRTEQERIAAYLDASCAVLDAAVAAKRRQLETLKAFKKATILRAVTQGLHRSVETIDYNIPNYGLTPRHWKRSKLRYEILVRNGDFASDKLQDNGEYFVFGGNGIMGRINDFNIDGETVVIGRVGVYCGNAHYVAGKAWISDNALIVNSNNDNRFLCHLFNTLNFNSQANNTAQPVITGTKIRNTYVALPPKPEQKEICQFIEEKERDLSEVSINLEAQINTLLSYRKSLIHECVTGKRRITEADVARVKMTATN